MGYVQYVAAALPSKKALSSLSASALKARMAFLPTRWKMRFPVLWNR